MSEAILEAEASEVPHPREKGLPATTEEANTAGVAPDAPETPAAARKGPVLKDVGSAGPRLRDAGAGPWSQPARSSTPPPTSAVLAGPPKPFAEAVIKGKEDWRKKATNNVSDGADFIGKDLSEECGARVSGFAWEFS